jgi:hypothetical protein
MYCIEHNLLLLDDGIWDAQSRTGALSRVLHGFVVLLSKLLALLLLLSQGDVKFCKSFLLQFLAARPFELQDLFCW